MLVCGEREAGCSTAIAVVADGVGACVAGGAGEDVDVDVDVKEIGVEVCRLSEERSGARGRLCCGSEMTKVRERERCVTEVIGLEERKGGDGRGGGADRGG